MPSTILPSPVVSPRAFRPAPVSVIGGSAHHRFAVRRVGGVATAATVVAAVDTPPALAFVAEVVTVPPTETDHLLGSARDLIAHLRHAVTEAAA